MAPKTTIHQASGDADKQPTPSEEVVHGTKTLDTEIDARGRVIKVKKPGALDRMKLFKLVGPEGSANQQYLGHAMLAYCVIEIDGDRVPKPTSIRELEALVDQLEDDGLSAAADALKRLNPDLNKEGGEVESVKN